MRDIGVAVLGSEIVHSKNRAMEKSQSVQEAGPVEELAEGVEKVSCSLCNGGMNGHSVFKIDNDVYHGSCLRCADCKKELREKCFKRDSNILCEMDYRRRYAPQCFLCRQPVAPKTPIRHIKEQVCHLICVRCTPCNRELHTGEKCRLNEENKLECLKDHSLSTYAFEGYTPYLQTLYTCPRRSRTIIYPHQYEELKRAFNANSKPSKIIRENLALKTGLESKIVQVWFQNQRAKWKRLLMKRTGRYSPLRTLPARHGHFFIAETERLALRRFGAFSTNAESDGQ